MKLLARISLAFAALLLAGTAFPQSTPYPVKPIHFIVPAGGGGYTDNYVRLIALHLGQALGQPVIVENRPGDSGNVGAVFVAKAAPDGYTFLATAFNIPAIKVSLYKDLPFDPVRDFTPVSLIAAAAGAWVVHPSLNVTSIGELIALARAQPGMLNYASPGVGSLGNLMFETIKFRAGIQINHIPYKAESDALLAAIRGDVTLAQASVGSVLPQVKAGRLRAIAITGATRSSVLPDVPTIAETLPGVSGTSWVGLFGPANLPPEITLRLNREIDRIVRLPEVMEHYSSDGITFMAMTPDQFSAFQRAEIAKWAEVIRTNKISIE